MHLDSFFILNLIGNKTPANAGLAESVPTVAGSHMTLFRPSAPKIRDGISNPGEVSFKIKMSC